MDNNNLNEAGSNNVQNSNYYQTETNTGKQPQKASGLAIASMICGIASIVLCCIWYLSAILGIAAIVMGIINNVKKMGGKGMALAGIITGAVGLVLVVLLLVFAAIGLASTELSNYIDYSNF